MPSSVRCKKQVLKREAFDKNPVIQKQNAPLHVTKFSACICENQLTTYRRTWGKKLIHGSIVGMWRNIRGPGGARIWFFYRSNICCRQLLNLIRNKKTRRESGSPDASAMRDRRQQSHPSWVRPWQVQGNRAQMQAKRQHRHWQHLGDPKRRHLKNGGLAWGKSTDIDNALNGE